DFTVDIYFRQSWIDPRLAFDDCGPNASLSVGAQMLSKLWVPDTFFVNEKHAYFHDATTKNTFLRISANGQVFVSIRLTLTAMCMMVLKDFPMDTQRCSIQVESSILSDRTSTRQYAARDTLRANEEVVVAVTHSPQDGRRLYDSSLNATPARHRSLSHHLQETTNVDSLQLWFSRHETLVRFDH
ncbi:PREDICTED: gamma-aminobutyric acid receptor subunit beta-like, partial [Priapulus caudatus]|uniref:Gamma-aminobutyric acid receptor subunit beta-like n=1 Tax=Priapulus caudatus TaxID=37621 RepID=A0ABM1FBN6_PRICU